MRFKRLFSEDRGAAAPLMALMIVAFVAMAALTVDVGRLYAQRADLQHSMDGAALAGAAAYIQSAIDGDPAPENRAFQAAQSVAGANGDEDVSTELLADYSAYDTRIRVRSSRSTDLYFARVLKIFSADVGAESTVRVWRAKGVHSDGNLIPLSLDLQHFPGGDIGDLIGTEMTLKLGSDKKSPGNTGAVQLGNQGGADRFREHLRYGYPHPLRVGDLVATETGKMTGPTAEALADRIGDTVLVPIVDLTGVNGKTEVPVLGFAKVRITELHSDNKAVHVSGQLLGLTNEGTDEVSEDGTGIWSYKLVKG